MTYYHLTLIINNQLKYYPAMAINPNNYHNKTITDFIDDEGFLDHFQKYVDDESIYPIPLDKIINEWVTKVRQDKLNSLLYDK